MPPYRATLSGAFGSGVHPRANQGIDVGGVIDAITGGAQGLVQQAYTRKQAEHAQRRQDEQLKLDREKEERQRDHEARMELASGIIRGGTSITRRPDPVDGATTSPTIADAFRQGFDTPPAGGALPHSVLDPGSGGALPQREGTPGISPALTTPIRVGSLGRVPSLDVTTTPDRYDPDQDRSRIRTLDAIGARGDVAASLEDRRQVGRTALEGQRQAGRVDRDAARHTFKLEEQADAAAARAQQSAAHDSRVTARGPGGQAHELTANGKEVAKRVLLDGLVGYHGDEAKVRGYLTEDEIGRESATKYGITEADITAAVGRAQSHVADQVVRAAGIGSPTRAAARVRDARAASRTSGASASTGAGPSSLPALTEAERSRAAQDPDYRAFKESKGYKF